MLYVHCFHCNGNDNNTFLIASWSGLMSYMVDWPKGFDLLCPCNLYPLPVFDWRGRVLMSCDLLWSPECNGKGSGPVLSLGIKSLVCPSWSRPLSWERAQVSPPEIGRHLELRSDTRHPVAPPDTQTYKQARQRPPGWSPANKSNQCLRGTSLSFCSCILCSSSFMLQNSWKPV